MIEKIDRISGRVFANDYVFFIVISLVFGGVCYLISYSLYRLGMFSQSDVSSFAHYWVVGFLWLSICIGVASQKLNLTLNRYYREPCRNVRLSFFAKKFGGLEKLL